MRKILPCFFSLFFITPILYAQCDAAFGYSINHDQVSFVATATGNAIKHSWQFGDGAFNDYSSVPVHSYTLPGQYAVLHTVRDSITNCIDSAFQIINLSFTPTCSVNFTYIKPSVLSGRYVFYPQVSISGSLQSIKWTIDGIQVSTGEILDYTFHKQGIYEVCVSIETDSGCVAQKCYAIKYQTYTNCNTGASFTYTNDPVQTRQINFAGLPDQPQLIYNWNYGDGNSGAGKNVSHLYQAGIYQARLIVTDSLNYCLDSLSQTIKVVVPTSESCTASFIYVIDQLGQASFAAISNQTITSQTWTINSADSLNPVVLSAADPIHNFTDTGSYYVCLSINTNTGCAETYCELIQVNNISGRPAVTLSYPNPVSGEQYISFNIYMERADMIKYKVCNLAGTIVYQSQKQGQPGTNIISIPVQQLMRGQYFIDILFDDKQRRTVFQKL